MVLSPLVSYRPTPGLVALFANTCMTRRKVNPRAIHTTLGSHAAIAYTNVARRPMENGGNNNTMRNQQREGNSGGQGCGLELCVEEFSMQKQTRVFTRVMVVVVPTSAAVVEGMHVEDPMVVRLVVVLWTMVVSVAAGVEEYMRWRTMCRRCSRPRPATGSQDGATNVTFNVPVQATALLRQALPCFKG